MSYLNITDSSSLSVDQSSDSGYLTPIYSNNNKPRSTMSADTNQLPPSFLVPLNGTLVKSRSENVLSLQKIWN